jgi:hypothetical protein
VVNRLCDFEQHLEVEQGGETFKATLTPVAEVRSALFLIAPLLQLEPAAADILRPKAAILKEEGVLLVDPFLIYAAVPAAGWRLEIGGQTLRIGSSGRSRLLISDLGGATTGILRHPSDDRLFSPIHLAQLSPGQITDTSFVLQLPFKGPCGMDERTLDEFCSGVIAAPKQLAPGETIRAKDKDLIVPASMATLNHCNQLVPAPTQFQLRRAGVYPQPRDFFSDGTSKAKAWDGRCEQTNGFVSPIEVVPEREGAIYYIGSTCHRFVQVGACANEQVNSDLLQMVEFTPIRAVELATELGKFFFDTPTIHTLRPPAGPSGDLACVDNHKGRPCQEILMGDVSLDFTVSTKAGVVFPDTKPELVIPVTLGEEVEFVLHNNGVFGSTFVGVTKQDIVGKLTRTHKEYAISPEANGAMQFSTDALLNSAPTAGLYQNFPTPGGPRELSPRLGGAFGLGAGSVEIRHFEVNSAIPDNEYSGFRYRYFPDVSLKYKAPGTATSGSDERFVFTVDGCTVPVTFRLSGGETAAAPPDPDEQLIDAPTTAIAQSHQVGASPCPQVLSTISINSTKTVTVTVSAHNALSVDPANFVMEPGQAAVPCTISFNCGTQTSFSGTVTITATTSDGESQQIIVPVSMTISGP